MNYLGVLALALAALMFASCGTTDSATDGYDTTTPQERSNQRLENRLDRREKRVDQALQRSSIRSDARRSRWQKMKDWEEDQYQKNWDTLME